ncbi:hypothetical protein [Chitinophaga sp. YIM B06452]|uniref:hypothetical protein n=1 Tax=Chitinophaga sp. YIM B06452 TaxID=3082158 RepID=UPI0031FED84A
MTIAAFKTSLDKQAPPAGLTPALLALWWDGKGDWDRSHDIAQEDHSRAGSWVHAYLHRKEGDAGNAAYWYARAGKAVFRGALEAEWEQIAGALLLENAG